MLAMGYIRKEVDDSLKHNKYDDVMATYLLLAKKTSEVSPRDYNNDKISVYTILYMKIHSQNTTLCKNAAVFVLDLD